MSTSSDPVQQICLCGVILDMRAFRVIRGRRSIGLTAAEADLLLILLTNPNRLVRHQDLVTALHAKALFVQGRDRIKFTVACLRKKLGRARSCLETVHGQGYLLNVAASAPREMEHSQ